MDTAIILVKYVFVEVCAYRTPYPADKYSILITQHLVVSRLPQDEGDPFSVVLIQYKYLEVQPGSADEPWTQFGFY